MSLRRVSMSAAARDYHLFRRGKLARVAGITGCVKTLVLSKFARVSDAFQSLLNLILTKPSPPHHHPSTAATNQSTSGTCSKASLNLQSRRFKDFNKITRAKIHILHVAMRLRIG